MILKMVSSALKTIIIVDLLEKQAEKLKIT